MKAKTGIQSPMKDLRGYLTNDELDRLENTAKTMDYKGCRYRNDTVYLLIRLLRVSGRRVSEILALKPSDIDFNVGQVMWGILKKQLNNEPLMRLKWIDKRTLEDLRIYILHHKIQPNQRIFNFGRVVAHRIVRKVGKAAGIDYVGSKPLHPHNFRHSFAINYLRKHKGSSQALRELQSFLEHSSLDMTAVYLQFSDEDMKNNYEEAINDVDNRLHSKLETDYTKSNNSVDNSKEDKLSGE